MKIIVNGACGRMGRKLLSLIGEGCRGSSLAAAVEKYVSNDTPVACYEEIHDYTGGADVIIDFSNHAAVTDVCDYAVRHKIPAVIATTGFTAEEIRTIKKTSENVAVFLAANMSVGVALLIQLAKRTAALMPGADIEIIEKHHNQKLDAPSGTALMIADGIKQVRPGSEYVYGRQGQHKREPNEIGIHSLRLGSVVGEHEVIVTTGAETITLKHEAHDRLLFAEGALAAAEFIICKAPGLYSMSDMLEVD